MSTALTSEAPPAEKKPAVTKQGVPARTAVGVNWTGAFVLYAKGMTLQEVADELDIDFGKLKVRARSEDWENMVRLNAQLSIRAPAVAISPLSAAELANVEMRIKANRESGLRVAQGLRSHIQRVLDAYAETNQFLPVSDIGRLAQAARAIDESSMLLLGDDPAPKVMPSEMPEKQPPSVKNVTVSHFHIHPPSAASKPRIERTVLASEEVKQIEGRAADAINDPSPEVRVELEPQGSAEDEDPTVKTAGGRSSIDFSKLAATAKAALDVAMPSGTLPTFARDN